MRKKGMVWFTLLLLLVSFIPSLIQAYVVYAQSPDEVSETIVKNDQLDVSTLVKQVDDQMLWEIKYQLNSPAPNIKQRLKFKIYQGELVETNLAAPENIEGWGYGNDNWFMPENFSQTTQGSIFVKTDLSVEQLVLKLQIDEEVTTETILATMAEDSEEPAPQETVEEVVVTENVLEAPISNPHQLSAPTVKVQVTQTPESAPMIEESAVATEEPEISTDAPVVEMPSSESEEGSQDESDTDIIVKNTTESSQEETETVDDNGWLPPSKNKTITNFTNLNPLVSPFSLNPYSDSFDYENDSLGKYPKHYTNRHLVNTSSNEDIRNFNYLKVVTNRTPTNNNAGQSSPANQVVNINDSNTLSNVVDTNGNVKSGLTGVDFTNFSDGYVAYWQPDSIKTLETAQEQFSKLILNKKTVKPIASDPTKFEIELDVIGGVTVNPNRLVDVVFVLDKSSSMNYGINTPGTNGIPSRWDVLKTAMTKFTDTLLTTENALGDGGKGYLRMGLASFGSNGTDTPFGEIGTFTSGIGFTSNKTIFNNHPIIKDTAYTSSGTPTFLGLDAGIEMFETPAYGARSNAEKIIIILTDGEPTFGMGQNYTNITNDSTVTNSGSGNTSKKRFSFTNTRTRTYFTGNGTSSPPSGTTMTSIRTSTINHAGSRPTDTIKRYSIGFGVSGVQDILTALGPEGQGEANDQNSLDNILTYFSNIIGPKTPYINNATINDPMSSYVTLDTSSVTITPLTLTLGSGGTNVLTQPGGTPTYITDINKTIDSTGITLSKVTLSGTANANRVNDVKYGLRLKYTVTLKEAYRDGLFYQTNGPTYLEQNNYTDSLGFTVPSVRYKRSFSIPFEKKWIDDNNDWNTRKAVTLKLQQKIGTGNWIDVTGQIKTLSASGPYIGSFDNVPYYSSGQLVKYRVVEDGRITGYGDPSVTPNSSEGITGNTENKKFTITNSLLYRDVVFKKTKSNGVTPLENVQFTIRKKGENTPVLQTVTSNGMGEVKFTHLPIGEYVIEEVEAPDNYKPIVPIEIKIEDQNKTLTLTGLPTNNIVKNYLKDYDLVVTKEDNYGSALEGAIFELKRTDVTPNVLQTVTVTDNKFTFTDLPAPGTYLLTETSPPNGFIGIDPVTITISENGVVTVTGNDSQVDKTDENKNIIKLTIKNKRKGQLPSTGGQGTNQFMWTTVILITLAGVVSVYYVYRNKKGAKVK